MLEVFERMGAGGQSWWYALREMWDKLDTVGQYKAAANGILFVGVVAYWYRGDFAKKFDQARLVYQVYLSGGPEEVLKVWLEDATGIKPESFTQQGLEDWAGKLVGMEAGQELGLDVDNAWPFTDLAASVIASVIGSIATGSASRLITQARADKWARVIASFFNKVLGMGFVGAAPKFPQSRKRMLANERQRRYRERRRWNAMLGSDPELDTIINDALSEIAAARITEGKDGFANRWDAERALG